MKKPITPSDVSKPVDQPSIITWYTCRARISSYAPFTLTKKVRKGVKSVKPAHLNSMPASDEDPEHTILWPMFFAGQSPGRCSTFTIRRHRIWSSPCMRVLFTVLLLVGVLLLLLLLLLSLLLSFPVRHLLRLVLGAAAAAAAPPPLPLMSVINGWVLEDSIEKALRKRK